MRMIYKYPIKLNSIKDSYWTVYIDAHKNANPISVGYQNGEFFVWAEIDTDQEMESQAVLICIGTGHGAIPDGYKHFQTVTDTFFVWHLYKKESS